MLAPLSLLLTIGTAQAAGADAIPFDLTTAVEAWPVTEVDSGWWPEEGPVRVRTVLFSEGLAGIDIAGKSIVEGSTHRLADDETEGSAVVELIVDASLYLSIDVAGYSWEDVLHEQTVEFDISRSFDSFAFAKDGGADLMLPMDEVDVFSVDQGIFPLVDVVVSGSLTPSAELSISTDSIETEWGSFTEAGQQINTSGGSTTIDAEGMLDAELSLVVQGHAEVCITWVDCYGDFNYDFPLKPIQHTQALTYEPVTLHHGSNGASAGDDPAGAKAGGCSTVPVLESRTLPIVLLLTALAYRRRQS